MALEMNFQRKVIFQKKSVKFLMKTLKNNSYNTTEINSRWKENLKNGVYGEEGLLRVIDDPIDPSSAAIGGLTNLNLSLQGY